MATNMGGFFYGQRAFTHIDSVEEFFSPKLSSMNSSMHAKVKCITRFKYKKSPPYKVLCANIQLFHAVVLEIHDIDVHACTVRVRFCD